MRNNGAAVFIRERRALGLELRVGRGVKYFRTCNSCSIVRKCYFYIVLFINNGNKFCSAVRIGHKCSFAIRNTCQISVCVIGVILCVAETVGN